MKKILLLLIIVVPLLSGCVYTDSKYIVCVDEYHGQCYYINEYKKEDNCINFLEKELNKNVTVCGNYTLESIN